MKLDDMKNKWCPFVTGECKTIKCMFCYSKVLNKNEFYCGIFERW